MNSVKDNDLMMVIMRIITMISGLVQFFIQTISIWNVAFGTIMNTECSPHTENDYSLRQICLSMIVHACGDH